MTTRTSTLCHTCVFAKPAVAGSVKTRLAATIGPVAAAELARAFLEDTWRTVSHLSWSVPVLATTDPFAHADIDCPAAARWQQGQGSLGDRLERILRRALAKGGTVLALGADSPGLPACHLDAAYVALGDADAVIGPCFDGGFYLLGLRRCPPGLLDGVPWSTPDAFDATCARLRMHGFDAAVLEPWFDVDRAADLKLLEDLLARSRLFAPATAAAMRRLAEDLRRAESLCA
jgi:rSAM/selenodomain-associated transferase 1